MSKNKDEEQQDGEAAKQEAAAEGKDKELKELQQQLTETNDSLMRLKAEFENYRRRTDAEKKDMYNRAVADVLKSLVNVFDDFDLALSHKQDGENFRKGMELIYTKLYQMAEDHGLERINTLGEQFDPNKHEVMLAEESDKPSQEVVEELQPGYKVAGKVIRNAKVKVAK